MAISPLDRIINLLHISVQLMFSAKSYIQLTYQTDFAAEVYSFTTLIFCSVNFYIKRSTCEVTVSWFETSAESWSINFTFVEASWVPAFAIKIVVVLHKTGKTTKST